MKQSTKLLSLVLALVMAFSCMTVIGNAALVKSEVSWDIIDDADLTPEQVADLALDLVDNDLLAGMEPIDLSIVGQLRLDSVDHIAADIDDLTSGFVWTIGKGLLGDLGDMNFDAIAGKQRSGGDLNFIYALLQFLADNSGRVSKVAYGIGSDNGISLGLVGNFLDLGDINDLLGNIPGFLTQTVYDMLVYGSYGYPDDAEALGGSLPTEMDTLDEIANNALLNLLVNPQDYDYEGEGDAAVKVWDEGSLLSPSFKAYVDENGRDAAISEISPLTNSLFAILDFAAPFAINDIAIAALNHNLKKALMLAVEAELNEIDKEALPASVATAFEVEVAEADKSYVTYMAYDKLAKSNSTWYYTTLETEVEEDANGDPVLDEEGNEISTKVRKYFKVNMAVANEFAKMINWDWEFVGTDAGYADADAAKEDGKILLSYEDLIANGSIASGINDLIGLVYENGLTDAAKREFEGFIGANEGEGWLPGNESINENVTNVTKYILVNFGDKVFGSDSAYANLEWEDIADYEILDLVALIGPEFFEDAMPQIILPKNADGTYAFHKGVQVWEFAAIVLRELISGIAPNVNYDAYIFENGDVTSANDRLFVEQDAEAWFNILLNMGIDTGLEYLINITNFRDFCAEEYGAAFDLDDYITNGGGTDEAHWQAILDAAILWACDYVGNQKSSSVLNGLDYNTIKAVDGPLNKLSTILNTLLPLGFIQGYQGAVTVNGVTKQGLDVAALVEGIKELLTTFDLNLIINLFGRDGDAYNFLEDVSLVQGVLDLANSILNLVFRANILQNTASNSLDAVVSQEALKTTIQTLLNSLNNSKTALLLNALPVVGKLIKGWGTEQSFKEPEISLTRTIDLTNGATTEAQTVYIRNASDGVWRHYRDAAGNEYTDNQYQIKPVQVLVYDGMNEGEASGSAYVTLTQPSTNAVDYGQSATFTYTAAGVTTSGALVRFEVQYQVLDEDGDLMADGKVFKSSAYAWLNYNATDAGKETYFNNDGSLTYAAIYAPHYVPLSTAADYIAEITTGKFGRDYKLFTSSQKGAIEASTQTIDGITFGNVSMTFSNSNGGRYFNDLKQFKTYTVQATNEDGESQSGSGNALTISGSVNAATLAAANKTSGSKTSFSVTLTAKGTTNGPHAFDLIYYDDVAYNKLSSLAASEMDQMRLASTYNLNGTAYANGILTTANTTDDEGETVYRDSNFTTTAWIAQKDCGKWAGTDSEGNVTTVTEYAESAVTNIVEEKDADDNVTGKTGIVEVDGEKISVRCVTKIDCNTAVMSYVAAFVPGIQGGMQAWNANSVYDLEARYENLYVTSNDVSYCRKSTDQVVAEGNGDDTSGAITTLAANLQTVEETYTYDYDFTDYKMYRLNRLNDVRDDIHALLQLVDDAKPATVAEIDEYFDYNWMEENDFRALVAGDEYEAFLVALLEKFDADEIKGRTQWLADRKLELARKTLLDIEMMDNLLARTSSRLLDRAYKTNNDGAAIDRQLVDEIASANNVIGTDASKYTETSWERYQDALNHANDVVNANGVVKSQKNVFSAKYNLLVARKKLVPAGMEADYTELNALIAQATQALENTSLYDNTNKDFGRVLAELGYNEIDGVQLFPGSALLVVAEGYHVEDQRKVDSAADALKEALSKLKFKNVEITGAGVTNETLVEADEEAGIEAVTAKVARIDALLDADAVKNLFSATADGADVTKDLINVSNDTIYTVDTDLEGYAGTDATVTFYTLVDDVKIPVATVKLVVEGDVTGNGVINVLDARDVELAANSHAELVGCYFLAGNLNTDDGITANDYSAVLNKALKS